LPNVAGLVLAGLADFKNDLHGSDLFDPRLQRIVVKIVDCSYGMENGFNQAIDLAAEALSNVKFVQEKKLISKFFEEIAQNTGRYCFGIRDVLYGLEAGSVQTLIVFEDLDLYRFVVAPTGVANAVEKVLYMTEKEAGGAESLKDPETGQDMEVKEKILVVEWLAESYKKFGCALQFVSDKSQEGSQFVKGFGGIGALIRYTLDFNVLDNDHQDEDDLYEYEY